MVEQPTQQEEPQAEGPGQEVIEMKQVEQDAVKLPEIYVINEEGFGKLNEYLQSVDVAAKAGVVDGMKAYNGLVNTLQSVIMKGETKK